MDFIPIGYKKRLEFGIEFNQSLAITVGRLDRNKNIDKCIRTVSDIKEVVLLICGDGIEKESLEELSEQLNVSNRVIFAGNRSDVIDLYQSADVFILLSKREGLSRSIMEAMASGLPCIVSKIRGNTDLISEGTGGYLVNPLDIINTSKTIKRLIENENLCRKFGQVNQEAIKTFDIQSVVEKLTNIYASEIQKVNKRF